MRAARRRFVEGINPSPLGSRPNVPKERGLAEPDAVRTGEILASGSLSLRALTRQRRAPKKAPLDPQSKSFLRRGRDANIDSLMGISALGLVNANGGIFARLNPTKAPITSGRRVVKDVEQRYQLIEVVQDLLRVGFEQRELDRMIRDAVRVGRDLGATPEDEAFFAVQHFLSHARVRVMHRARAYRNLPRPADVDDDLARELAGRLSRVRWIEAGLEEAHPTATEPPQYKDDLTALFALPTAETAQEALDLRFESVMNRALDYDLLPATLTHLKAVRFDKHLPDAGGLEREARPLPRKHPVRAALTELQARLDEGERSAVGGSDYATQTFPEGILEAAASKQLSIVAFDGSTADGIDYVRNRYGIDRQGRRQGCRVMGLEAIYGSHPRSIVTLDDGRQFLLVTGIGKSRQLNNAAMLLLFQGREGSIRAEDIDLASDGRDMVEVLRADLSRVLRAEDEAEDRPTPTRLMILQNPLHLEHALGGRLRWSEHHHDTLLPMRIAYVTKKDGSVERLIAPKVGGGGVYGDNAGAFVKAFFTAGSGEKVQDVIFNGAAGGFANTAQLPDVEPGGLIAPQREVTEYGGDVMQLPTMLSPDEPWPPAVQKAIEEAGVHLTDRHVAVAAPSIETYPLIHELADDGNASIDVEAASITRAVLELRREGQPVTFTPVYTHSDDPRRSEEDRFDSLAMRGPLFEGSRFDPALYSVITTLAEL